MEAGFKTDIGDKAEGFEAIVPLFTSGKNNEPIFRGTAFFISADGMLLTAKHCIIDNDGKRLEDLFIYQFPKKNVYIQRPIGDIFYNNSDAAILLPVEVFDNKANSPLRNKVMTLSTIRPVIGEQIASYAFPKTHVTFLGTDTRIDVNDMWHFGNIEDYHEDGISILKNPCFQSSMHILHGSSGGPVADSKGRVIAINSSGSDVSPDLTPYSFLTPIEQCFDIETVDGSGNRATLRQLSEKGYIILNNSN